MERKIGTFCMGLGVLLMFAALSLFLWNRWEAIRAKIAAEEAFSKLVSQMDTGESEEFPNPYDTEMGTIEVDGYAYIGYITIPSFGLQLPVMSDWDYNRLKTAPCRYAGSTKTNDLVIAAHNYIRHFGPLGNIKMGDKVYFTDVDDVHRSYTVATVETLPSTSIEDMTAGEYALTLFTCDYGGNNRVTVRCELTESK